MIMWKIILACLAVSDSRASVADSEITSNISTNSSATTTITITMTGALNEQFNQVGLDSKLEP
jgi:hypothetical protein